MSGPTGYADYQRTLNYDDPFLINQTAVKEKPITTHGPFDVSRFAYVAGRIAASGEGGNFTFVWSLDEAGTQIVGERQMIVAGGLPASGQIRLMNLGPWLRIKLAHTVGGAEVEVTLQLFPTNRIAPIPLSPLSSVLVSTSSVMPEKSSSTTSPTSLYAGPVRWLWESAVVETELILEIATEPGVFIGFDALKPPAGGGFTVGNTLVPLGQWRVKLVNNAAAPATVAARVWASETGST